MTNFEGGKCIVSFSCHFWDCRVFLIMILAHIKNRTLPLWCTVTFSSKFWGSCRFLATSRAGWQDVNADVLDSVWWLQPASLEIGELTGSASESAERHGETSSQLLNGSCSADDHALDNCTFSSLQRCHVCNKFLWGLLRQGYHCRGALLVLAVLCPS